MGEMKKKMNDLENKAYEMKGRIKQKKIDSTKNASM
jgi:hypothetical protein